MKILATWLRFLSIVCCLSWQLKLANSQSSLRRTNSLPTKTSTCSFDTVKLQEFEPLYLKNDSLNVQQKYSFVIPFDGKISIMEGKEMKVVCNSYQTSHNGLPLEVTSFFVNCNRDGKFNREGVPIDLSSFKCPLKNKSTVRKKPITGKCFNGNGDLMQVGFDIPLELFQFVVLYESCIDNANKNVVYVSSKIHGSSILKPMKVQKNEKGSWKDEGFDVIRTVSNSYADQETRLKLLLGYNPSETMPKTFFDKVNTNQGFSLDKGHLSPRADHLFTSWRDATYYTLNAVPQWHRVNSINIDKVEATLRAKANLLKSDLNVISGSFGVAQGIHKVTKALVDLKLSPEKTKVPTPKWLFKVVENPLTKEMISFLVLNNPHKETVDADIASLPCNDLFQSNDAAIKKAMKSWKSQISQINNKAKNKADGYTIACKVGELKTLLPYLPIDDSGKLLSYK